MVQIADPRFDQDEIEAVRAVLEDGMVADGPEVRRFESEFADYCGSDHATATANGTAALQVALEALGLGRGDTVVTTPFSFVASANAIRLVGARPVFADIDPATFNLDPEAVRNTVRETDADAVLAVHLYGLPAPMDALGDIASDHDLYLIEDAAQAHGAEFDGIHVGTFGDAAAFSFYPTKNMSTGEGGMVLTDSEAVANRAASYVNHGRSGDSTYAHERVGHNLRMTSIAAAIGRRQLQKLPEWVEARRENATRLTEGLADVPEIQVPEEPDHTRHAYNQYTIRSDDRDGLCDHLSDHDIGTAIYYPTPIPKLEAYDGFSASTPIADSITESVLSLPIHPRVEPEDLDRIVEAIRGYH